MNKQDRITSLLNAIKQAEIDAMWAWRGGEDHEHHLAKRRELVRELQLVKD